MNWNIKIEVEKSQASRRETRRKRGSSLKGKHAFLSVVVAVVTEWNISEAGTHNESQAVAHKSQWIVVATKASQLKEKNGSYSNVGGQDFVSF